MQSRRPIGARWIPVRCAFILASLTGVLGACGPSGHSTGPEPAPTPAPVNPGPSIQTTYTLVPLAAVNAAGTMGSARAVNDLGIVTGRVKVPTRGGIPSYRGFRYSSWDGNLTLLPLMSGYQQCEGHAINDAGTIAGWCYGGGTAVSRAFTWTAAGGLVPLAGGVASWAHGVDPSGAAVGAYSTKLGQVRAAYWSSSATLVDLHPSTADSSRAVGRNTNGDMVINAWYPGGRVAALRLIGGSAMGFMTLPPAVPGGWTVAHAINYWGEVAGAASGDASVILGARWGNSGPPFVFASAYPTIAWSISYNRRIVGQQGSSPNRQAFTRDLNGNWNFLYLPNEDGIAYGVNRCGTIVGEGMNRLALGQTRALMWVPSSCDP